MNQTPAGLMNAPNSKWGTGTTADLPFLEGVERVVRQRWETTVRNVSKALSQSCDDIEAVHRVRVSTRRLEAALKTFGDSLPRRSVSKALDVLRRLRRRCGESRDLDVQVAFIEKLLPHVSASTAAGMGVLHSQLLRLRSKARKKLQPRLERSLKKLHQVGDRLVDVFSQQHQQDSNEQSFNNQCLETLERDFKKFWKNSSGEMADSGQLHALRVKGKGLRYTLEIAGPILGAAFREEFYPQLERVQNELGQWNDAVVAASSLSRLRKKFRKRCDRHEQCKLPGMEPISWSELENAFSQLEQSHREKGEQSLVQFRENWPDFATTSFHFPVHDLIVSARERESISKSSQQQLQLFQAVAPDRKPVRV